MWRQAPILGRQLYPCGETELAALTTARRVHAELLVDGSSPHPLQLSTDGGAAWTNLTLPALHHLAEGISARLEDQAYAGLTPLPNGSLLLTGGGSSKDGWQLLSPGASKWCAVAARSASWQTGPQLSTITIIGRNLWWLAAGQASNGSSPIEAHELPLSAIRCG